LRALPQTQRGVSAILLDNHGGREVGRGHYDPHGRIAFRVCITQRGEALTNIARHSRATKITVNLIAEHDFVQLKIHDNGIGITSEALDGIKSLGLLGMRERARSLGGDVEITGNPDQGLLFL
jgi:signal transduction histidine kinase